MPEPRVGEKYIATDNAAAITALCGAGYPIPQGVIYVTVAHVYPQHRKLQVRPDGLWLTFDELERWFRRAFRETSLPNEGTE